MKIKELYRRVIEIGMNNDPRPKKRLKEILRNTRKSYRSLKGVKKETFDKDSLFNPYADTRVLYGSPDTEINRVMVGIDIDGTELLVADRLNRMQDTVDLVISHHPGGRSLSELHKVMELQGDQLKRLGIQAEVADDLMKERMAEVSRSLHSRNVMRSIDIARILSMPYMCAHTAADNMVNRFLQKFFDKKRPKSVKEIVDLLEGIYEYKEGCKAGFGPQVFIARKEKPAGRIFVDMTGGTEGSKRVFARLSQAGIGTLISMHLSEEHFKCAKTEHINVVVAGHIPSDSIGLNLLLDELIKQDDLDIIPCSGFIRHSRL